MRQSPRPVTNAPLGSMCGPSHDKHVGGTTIVRFRFRIATTCHKQYVSISNIRLHKTNNSRDSPSSPRTLQTNHQELEHLQRKFVTWNPIINNPLTHGSIQKLAMNIKTREGNHITMNTKIKRAIKTDMLRVLPVAGSRFSRHIWIAIQMT